MSNSGYKLNLLTLINNIDLKNNEKNLIPKLFLGAVDSARFHSQITKAA
jgi:hypothetical protein